MAPGRMNTFVTDDVMPSWWANAIQQHLSGLTGNLVINPFGTTAVTVAASAGDGAVMIPIQGKWRWRESNVGRAHPGGAAGWWYLWAVAANNSIAAGSPQVDNTNYSWDLRFTATSSPPAVEAGVAEISRAIAVCYWDGAAITAINQLFGEPRRTWAAPYASRPPASSFTAGWTFHATDTQGTFYCDGSQWILVNQGRPVVSAIPTTALYAGREITYFPFTDQEVWVARYNPTAVKPWKWEILGASPAIVAPPATAGPAGAYGSPGLDDPDARIVPPLRGLYVIEAKAVIQVLGAGVSGSLMTLRARQNGAAVTDEGMASLQGAAANDVFTLLARGIVGLNATDPVCLNYYRDAGPSIQASRRWLSLQPVAVY